VRLVFVVRRCDCRGSLVCGRLLFAPVVAGALINIGKGAVRENDSAPIAG
jgi:hypothetical protein